jgi:endonuclease G, mitochondrial
MISAEQLKRAEQRYRDTSKEREDNKKKLDEGLILEADTKARVARRFSRLAQARPEESSPKAAAILNTLGDLPEVSTPGMVSATVLPVDTLNLAVERIIGESDFVGVSYVEYALRIARTVGRISVRTASGVTLGWGTGFLVSPRLLLTNNHVLEDITAAANSWVEFNYQYDIFGHRETSVLFDLQPNVFFLTDQDLDYSLVAVSETSHDGQELKRFGWNPMIEEEGKVIVGDHLSIIQHPEGQPKQLALRENRLVTVLENFLHYETDTNRGSSGSPVYNDQWEVVALHHQGVSRVNSQGKPLKKDGTVWKQGMPEDDIDYIANEGVRISRIIKHVKGKQLSGQKAQLRTQMLDSTATPYVLQGTLGLSDELAPIGLIPPDDGGEDDSNGAQPPANTTSTVSTSVNNSTAVSYGGPTVQPDGTATWTIPLEISVRLGQPGAMPGTGTSSVRDAAEPASGDLAAALQDLENSQTKPYYSATKDNTARSQYYQGMPGTTATSAEMYDWFHNLLESTHSTQLKYKPATQVYPWVDLHEDRKLQSIYSGNTFDPNEFIREDFEVDRVREQRMQEIQRTYASSAGGNGHAAEMEAAVDLLEATLPYNCEHVVPQSWFDHREPMRGDLHHLFACEKNCNSFRSNTPYYDFPDFEEVIRDACGKRDSNRFEPSANKGAVARATLYFLLRYPGEINRTNSEYRDDRVTMLLDWHRENPVTKYERHRNAAIFEKQGNRNPLIDFPDLADKIDFLKGLGQ